MVKILLTEDKGQVVAGTVELVDGECVFSAAEGYEGTMEMVQDHVCFDAEGEEYTEEDDPKKWYSLLPSAFNGSMMRATGDEEDSSETQDAMEGEANFEFQGLDICIENLRGSTRHGKTFNQRMTVPYGYIVSTRGTDGDEVDCFVGAVLDAPYAFVVHTVVPGSGQFDEDKVMLGFESAKSAYDCFIENYSNEKFFGSMEKIPMHELKQKLKSLRGRKLTKAS